MNATTTKKLSKRATTALEVLAAGGYFRNQLETTYMGRDQFKTRLIGADRKVVPGVGHAAMNELLEAGRLQQRIVPASSLWKREWVLAA